MNLKLHLLSRIVFIAALCLIATAAYVLIRGDQQSKQNARASAESIGRQLEVQLMRIDAGFDLPERFPDLDLWKEVSTVAGACARFTSETHTLIRRVCSKGGLSSVFLPLWFETLYRWAFNPGFAAERTIAFNGRFYGAITVSLNEDIELSRAWNRLSDLFTLSAVTLVSVCMLVYLAIRQALQPAQMIVTGLERMQRGELSYRLPNFELTEWQRTGAAINQLAASQEQLLSERRQLTLKLMTLQEEERRYLARELHDELGQCLAGIQAVAASIAHTAAQACPALVPEAKNISKITDRIMAGIRGLLLRLRPTDLDELGLSTSLNSLVMLWNAHSGGKIHYRLVIEGELDALPEPLPIAIFRTVQECLTNIARHSEASRAEINIETVPESKEKQSEHTGHAVSIDIRDNGIATRLPFTENPGIGLLGIRERVAALGGRLILTIGRPSGLNVKIWLPIPSGSTAPS